MDSDSDSEIYCARYTGFDKVQLKDKPVTLSSARGKVNKRINFPKVRAQEYLQGCAKRLEIVLNILKPQYKNPSNTHRIKAITKEDSKSLTNNNGAVSIE